MGQNGSQEAVGKRLQRLPAEILLGLPDADFVEGAAVLVQEVVLVLRERVHIWFDRARIAQQDDRRRAAVRGGDDPGVVSALAALLRAQAKHADENLVRGEA